MSEYNIFICKANVDPCGKANADPCGKANVNANQYGFTKHKYISTRTSKVMFFD